MHLPYKLLKICFRPSPTRGPILPEAQSHVRPNLTRSPILREAISYPRPDKMNGLLAEGTIPTLPTTYIPKLLYFCDNLYIHFLFICTGVPGKRQKNLVRFVYSCD